MTKPKTEYIILRSPRTDNQGNMIQVNIQIVKVSETDLTGYSFLRDKDPYEEWVPTQDLGLYKRARGVES
jgi:hypothetical protein